MWNSRRGSAVKHDLPISTRYQGSKLKLLDFVWENVRDLRFDTVLDAFGGTGCVSYLMKAHGKSVTYNDYLRFNQLIGQAIVENSCVRLSPQYIRFVLRRHRGLRYGDFIARTFRGVYFTDEENAWLDTVCQNIPRLGGRYKRAMAYYALFQACLVKRPYNLFHRRNLYLRTAEVRRTFGNKATWDLPFEEHFRGFVEEANGAVFGSGRTCRAVCGDATEVPGEFDLVYIDPPYVSRRGVGVDYLDFYHFLEGLADYDRWPERIDRRKKHLPLLGERSAWSDAKRTREAFQRLLARYARSILVVSYRSDGIPSEEELVAMLGRVKRRVRRIHYGQYKYALSTNAASKEVLLVGHS